MWIVLLLLSIAIMLYLLLKPDLKGFSMKGGDGIVSFFSRGLDAGFKLGQIRMLWKASSLADLEKPCQIYWSLDELDRCLQILIDKYDLLKSPRPNHPLHDLLKKMFEYRKRVEFNRPQYRSGIQTTRDIPINQPIKIRDNHVGIYQSTIVANADSYMVLEYPKGDPLPLGFSWRDRILNIYFWRENDAGYFFETKLLDNYQDREEHKHLRMAHSDYLLRSQKRRSVRASCDLSAQLYRLQNSKSFSNHTETNRGIFCRIIDLSEDGLALRISGRGKRNMPVKVQFNLKGNTIVMNGVVRNIRYEKAKDQSLLHIEAVTPPEISRLAILAYVYDVDRSRYREQKAKEEEASKKNALRKEAMTEVLQEINGSPVDVVVLDNSTSEIGIDELEELEELN